MLEKDIQLAICDYLALRKHFFWRNNTVGMYDPTKKVYRAMPKYGMTGIPDIILVKNGQFWGLEVKTAKTTQSENQREFEGVLKENGGIYHVVRSVDDVQALGL